MLDTPAPRCTCPEPTCVVHNYCTCPVAGGPATTAPQCPLHPIPRIESPTRADAGDAEPGPGHLCDTCCHSKAAHHSGKCLASLCPCTSFTPYQTWRPAPFPPAEVRQFWPKTVAAGGHSRPDAPLPPVEENTTGNRREIDAGEANSGQPIAALRCDRCGLPSSSGHTCPTLRAAADQLTREAERLGLYPPVGTATEPSLVARYGDDLSAVVEQHQKDRGYVGTATEGEQTLTLAELRDWLGMEWDSLDACNQFRGLSREMVAHLRKHLIRNAEFAVPRERRNG